MFTITIIITLVYCCCFRFSWSVWFYRYLKIIIWSVSSYRYNLSYLAHGGAFHAGLVFDDAHGIHYFQKAFQWKYLCPLQFNNTLNITHGHTALHFIGHKNSHARRIGVMLGDGNFTIYLQNVRFDVVARIISHICNSNRRGNVIWKNHKISLFVLISILWSL